MLRRSFLARFPALTLLQAPAASLRAAAGQARAAWQAARHTQDDWFDDNAAKHRVIFDTWNPEHFPDAMLFAGNTFETNKSDYDIPNDQLTVVVCCRHRTTPFAFNDAMWAKYGLGEYSQVKDASGKWYTHNVFNKLTPQDGHLVIQAIQSPPIPELVPLLPALSIANLQQMGTKFLLCNNAFGAFCLDLQARGKGKADEMGKDMLANTLPGVTLVPAMVIAIEKAQAAGIRYNRQ